MLLHVMPGIGIFRLTFSFCLAGGALFFLALRGGYVLTFPAGWLCSFMPAGGFMFFNACRRLMFLLALPGGLSFKSTKVSQPWELPPQLLAEPCVRLSSHTAPIDQAHNYHQ